MTDRPVWQKAQEWENNWWGSCANTYWEETKQLVYARKMGLTQFVSEGKIWFDLEKKSILDIGGGPVSLLLKGKNPGNCWVVDPCGYPDWVKKRYETANVAYHKIKGEDLSDISFTFVFDEVWIYNVLQHTDDPSKIIANARKIS